MFQKTAASFDECSTAGVFLSTLHCPDYRSELLFPADIQTLSSGEPPELPDLGWVEMTDLKAALQQCAEDRQICPSLAGFQFTKWDSEAHNESVSALVDKFKKKDQVFDLDAEVEDSDCEDFPNGPLEDDFDASDEADQTEAGDRTELRSWKEPCQVQSCQDEVIPLGDGDIWTLCPLLSMKPGEYSYFSPVLCRCGLARITGALDLDLNVTLLHNQSTERRAQRTLKLTLTMILTLMYIFEKQRLLLF